MPKSTEDVLDKSSGLATRVAHSAASSLGNMRTKYYGEAVVFTSNNRGFEANSVFTSLSLHSFVLFEKERSTVSSHQRIEGSIARQRCGGAVGWFCLAEDYIHIVL